MTSCAQESQTTPLAQLLADIPAALRAAGVPVLQLRPRSFDDPALHEGDYDFLIDHRRRRQLLATVISLLADQQHHFLVHTPSRPGSRKTVVQIHDPAAGRFVTLEFWDEALFKPGRRLCGAWRWRALRWGIQQEEGQYRLTPQAGALLFIAHLHAKAKRLSSPMVLERLIHYRKSIAVSSSNDALSNDLLPLLDELFFGNISIAEANRQAMRLLRQHTPLRMLSGVVRMQVRQLVAPLRRLGRRFARRVISVEGPDGSGKTTLVEALYKNAAAGTVRARVFKDFFRERWIYKSLCAGRGIFRRAETAPRNLWEEHVGGILCLTAIPAFCWNVLKSRGQILVLDRYFYDYLMVDIRTAPARQRRPWRQALLAFLPRPGLVINPLAEHHTTLNHEDPLSARGFDAYQRQLVAMLSRHPPASFAHIPASQGLQACVEQALSAAKRCGMGYIRKNAPPRRSAYPARMQATEPIDVSGTPAVT